MRAEVATGSGTDPVDVLVEVDDVVPGQLVGTNLHLLRPLKHGADRRLEVRNVVADLLRPALTHQLSERLCGTTNRTSPAKAFTTSHDFVDPSTPLGDILGPKGPGQPASREPVCLEALANE